MQRSTVYVAAAIAVIFGLALRFEHSLERTNAMLAALASARQVPGPSPARVVERVTVLAPRVDDQGPTETLAPSGKPPPTEQVLPHEQLRERFASEQRDHAWGPDMEHDLDSHLRALPHVNGGISSVRCRTSMCEITGVFDSKEDYNKVMFGLFAPVYQPPGSSDALQYSGSIAMPLELGEDGKYHASVFVGRPGTVLVDPEREP